MIDMKDDKKLMIDLKNYLNVYNICEVSSFDIDYEKGIIKVTYKDYNNDLQMMNIIIKDFEIFLEEPEYVKTFQDSIAEVFKELRDDKEYFIGWQANIAMAIIDNRRWFLEEYGIDEVPKEMEIGLANRTAKYFLNQLIHERKG